MDQRTRKLMTMHNFLYSRDDVDRLYVLRKEGGRGLTNLEDSVNKQLKDQRKNKKLENKDEKKSNWIDSSSDKQANSHTRKNGHG